MRNDTDSKCIHAFRHPDETKYKIRMPYSSKEGKYKARTKLNC